MIGVMVRIWICYATFMASLFLIVAMVGEGWKGVAAVGAGGFIFVAGWFMAKSANVRP